MLEARDAIIVVGKRRWNVSRAFEFAPAKPLSKELSRFNLKRSLFVSLFGAVRPCVSVSLKYCIVSVAVYFIDIALY